MGDTTYMEPDLQSGLDIQKSIKLKENHAGQNGMRIDEPYVSSIQEENLPELPSSEGGVLYSTKSPPQQNGYHAEMEEGETASGRLKPEIESEAAQTDKFSLDKNGSIDWSSHEATEEDLNVDKARDCNVMPENSQVGMQEAGVGETHAQAPANVALGGAVVNEGHPCSSDSSNMSSMGETVGDEKVKPSNAFGVGPMRGDKDDTSSKAIEDNANVEECYSKEEKNGEGRESERHDESLTGSATGPSVSTESNLKHNVQPPLFSSVEEIRGLEHEGTNDPGGEIETPSLTSDTHTPIKNEEKLREGEWLDQGNGVAVVISNDMQGWQRFDAEEVDTFTNPTQGLVPSLQPWEKLLDDGLDEREILNPPLPQLAIAPFPFEILDDGLDDGQREILNPPLPQLAIAPFRFEENKFGLASPGNPFMESLGRVSSFSDADGFAQSRDLPSSVRLSHSLEGPSPIQWREGQNGSASGNDDISPVLPALGGETNESVNKHESNLDPQLPPVRRPLASFDAMEPFEAPSFMSLVDPKSHALFGASMPTFQASNTGYGQENGEETWVANFDLMAPSTQEITRSTSMPRSGGETAGQRPGQSFSFATSREQERSEKESESPQTHQTKLGFLPARFSPVVQKVVDKVRTTPAVANGVLNSVRQAVSPRMSEKKPKSLLTRCICW